MVIEDLLTNAIIPKPVQGLCNVLGKKKTGRVVCRAKAKAVRITPATDGHAHLCAMIKHGSDVPEWLERSIFTRRVRGEEGRVGKGSDDMSDAGSECPVWKQFGMVLIVVHYVAKWLAAPRLAVGSSGAEGSQAKEEG